MTAIYAIVSESSEGKFFHSFFNSERSARLALDGLYEFGVAKKGCFYKIKQLAAFSKADIERWISVNRSKNV